MGTVQHTDTHGEWRSVPGFDPQKIIVSSLGFAQMSVRGSKRAVCLPEVEDDGYRKVKIGGKRTGVHTLIAMAWYGLPSAGMTADHLNNDPKDNRAENIRWASKTQQVANRRSYTTYRGSKQDEPINLPGEVWKDAH